MLRTRSRFAIRRACNPGGRLGTLPEGRADKLTATKHDFVGWALAPAESPALYFILVLLLAVLLGLPLLVGDEIGGLVEVYERFPDEKAPLFYSFASSVPRGLLDASAILTILLWPAIGLLNAIVTRPSTSVLPGKSRRASNQATAMPRGRLATTETMATRRLSPSASISRGVRVNTLHPRRSRSRNR